MTGKQKDDLHYYPEAYASYRGFWRATPRCRLTARVPPAGLDRGRPGAYPAPALSAPTSRRPRPEK
jgi:hypothetical protein